MSRNSKRREEAYSTVDACNTVEERRVTPRKAPKLGRASAPGVPYFFTM
jgi:hypothetical protein